LRNRHAGEASGRSETRYLTGALGGRQQPGGTRRSSDYGRRQLSRRPRTPVHPGQPVASFRIASTPRVNIEGEWKDGDSLFLTCNVWRQAAENVAESLQRGMRVIVTGRLKQRNYETKEGEKRTVYEVEVEVDDVGPSLRNASAKVNQGRAAGPGRRREGRRVQRRPVLVRRPERGPVGVVERGVLDEPPF
jgi:single stranded DNA-binding protein